MGNLYLVSHGQDEDNEAGILNGHRNKNLTPLGENQAFEAAIRLIDLSTNIAGIISSPLERAMFTARVIKEVIGICELREDPNLIERDFGILTGKPFADIAKYATKVLKTEKVTYFLEGEGVETFPQTFERAQKVLQKIDTSLKGKDWVLVAHGDIIKMIQAAYWGWPWEKALAEQPFIKNTDIIVLPHKES